VKLKYLLPVVVVGLLAASCAGSSDDTGSSTVPSASDQSAPPDTTATAPADTTLDTTAAPSDGTVEPATTPPAVSSTTVPGPLPVPTIELVEVGQFEQPVNITSRGLDGRIFVIEQDGRIVAFDDLSTETVLDITDLTSANAEQGLLGLAFHPELDLAYVHYTDLEGNTVVAEYEIDPDTAVFDADSFRLVYDVIQPFPNHNGGNLAFGPDGFLYIGLGDGGAADDPNRFALDLSNPFGKIHRIDPLCPPTTHLSEVSAKPSGRTVYAIRGVSLSTPLREICGLPMSARTRWRKSTWLGPQMASTLDAD